MNLQTLRQTLVRRAKERPLVSGGIGLAVIVLAVILLRTSSRPVQAYSFYEAKRGNFLVSVVEGGTLQAVNEVSIRNEVEGVSRIIYIIPEGSYVKKGDLLVELDSSQTQDTVNQQQINVEKAQFAVIQSEQQLEIQKSIADSEITNAALKVEFAESDLKKYLEGEALQLRRNAQIAITNVLETEQVDADRLQWSERLYKDGFETKGNLDKDRLTVDQDKLKLEQTQQALWMVETFDIPKQQRLLESARDESKENLERVKLQNERRLAQAEADLASQKRTLQLSLDKLERDKKQLVATKLYAPQDGLVVYGGAEGGGRFSNESMIEEGATVRNRQELIKLPDVSAMKLAVKIHESHINQVRLGQQVLVVLDAMPDQRFNGVVNRVAPLPDSQSRWSNPDLKVYATEILVTDKLPDVKPGVSARAEIIITNLPDVLTVPLQAVTTRKGKQVVFLTSAPDQPVPVTVGEYNTKFIEITSGLKERNRVLLAPPFDTKEKDLGGAIIADDETLPASTTKQPVASSTRNGNGRDQSGSANSNGDAAPATGGAQNTAAEGPSLASRDESQRGDRRAEKRGRPEGAEADANRISPQELLKQFDADGDGKLSGTELAALLAGTRGGPGGGTSGGSLTNRPDLMKQFDTDGDGKLNESELAAMENWTARLRGNTASPATPLVN